MDVFGRHMGRTIGSDVCDIEKNIPTCTYCSFIVHAMYTMFTCKQSYKNILVDEPQ